MVILSPGISRAANAERAAKHLAACARRAGHSAVEKELGALRIAPCLACDACWETGRCAQEDDMAEILRAMRRTDLVVLVSPMFWYGMSGKIASAIERMHPMTGEGRPVRSAALFVRNNLPPFLCETGLSQYENTARRFGWRDQGVVMLEGLDGKGAIGCAELEKVNGLVRSLTPRNPFCHREKRFDARRRYAELEAQIVQQA